MHWFMLYLLALLGGSSAYAESSDDDWMPSAKRLVIVEFVSVPSGASVQFKGRTICKKTPCQANLPEGTNTVSFQFKNKKTVSKTFHTSDRGPIAGKIKPSKVTVSFTSEPSGATVKRNGKRLCKTPCERKVKSGPQSVSFVKRGYQQSKENFDARENTAVHTSLISSRVNLSVDTRPEGVNVYLNGTNIGKSPIKNRKVLRGKHVISINDKCYKRARETVETEMREVNAYIRLQERVSAIQATAKRGDNAINATIYVDGSRVGQTGEVIKVPLCSKSIKLVNQDGQEWQRKLSLREKKLSRLSARFKLPKLEQPEDEPEEEVPEDPEEIIAEEPRNQGGTIGGVVGGPIGGTLGDTDFQSIHWSQVTIKRQVKPKFPKILKSLLTKKSTAICTAKFYIDQKGIPEKIEFPAKKNWDCPKVIHEDIKTALFKWRFYPYRNNRGQTVKSTFVQRIKFRLN